MEIIKKYFDDLSTEQIEQLTAYSILLKDWNQKMNLISRKNEEKIAEQHILHALSIANVIDFLPNSDILDLGTGGGLPGIPLSILFPESNFHLIDSIGKKVRAVSEMAKELKLNNVTAEQCRAENHKGKYDFVVTRAVARIEKLVSWTNHLFKPIHQHEMPNGILALKGGDLNEETEELKKDFDLIDLSYFFDEDFFATKKILYVNMAD